MAVNRCGTHALRFPQPTYITGFASVVGKKEGEGPLQDTFDEIRRDAHFGENSWEKAESALQKEAITLAAAKAGAEVSDMQMILAGDLLNQCIGSAYASRQSNTPFVGLYGACSTMAEGLLLGACLVNGGYADRLVAAASSHFCAAERQYRFPLAYGGQRTPTAQWTATAAGATVLETIQNGSKIVVTGGAFGQMVDLGIKDANNMGAAMAPAAYQTLADYMADTNTTPIDYDLIVTGDLARVGGQLLVDLFQQNHIDIAPVYTDCGTLLFRPEQDVHAGGSGCGCSAAVLCGKLLRELSAGKLRRILFAGTGALMSPTALQQGQCVVGICHVVELQYREEHV